MTETAAESSAHEVVQFPNGEYSVRPVDPKGLSKPGEPMHSRIGAWTEAQHVYIEPSLLALRAQRAAPPLIVYDLGLGIATNALAALEAYLLSQPRRDLHIVSVEKHLDALHLALRSTHFPWLKRHANAVKALLKNGHWSSSHGDAAIHWTLKEGSFEEFDLSAETGAEIIFFDFYSPKTSPELWTAAHFQKLHKLAAPSAHLMTYSASTAVRAALLLAGFYVGQGPATAIKAETTVASIDPKTLAHPLGRDWLERLHRSGKPLPPDWATQTVRAFEQIAGHPQFH